MPGLFSELRPRPEPGALPAKLVVLAYVLLLGCRREVESSEDSAASAPTPDAPTEPAVPMPGPGWCSVDGWCWLQPDSHGSELRGVWAFAPDNAWAVGEGGLLVHWDGGAWSRVELDVERELVLHDVWAASPERLFVAAHDGSILSFDPRATPISEITRAEPNEMPKRSLWGSGANDIYALAPGVDYGGGQKYDAVLFHFDGSAWAEIEPGPLASAAVVCGSAADDVYVLGDFGQVARFDGQSWHKQQSPTSDWLFRDAWADANGLLAVAGADRLVERAGEAWTVGASTRGLPTDVAGEGAGLTAVTRFADGEIWAGSDGGSLLVWKHERWSATVLREGHAILDVATAGERLFAVGEAGTALVVERGEPWTVPVGTRRHSAHAITGLGEHVWVADEFNLWAFDGEHWTTHEVMPMTRALWPVSPTEVHLIGEFGYRRFDGQTMHPAELPHSQFHGEDVWASGSDDVWLAAREHLMHFDGQGWQAETIEVEAWDMHGGDDNLLVAGPSKGPRGDTGMVGIWAVARRSGGNWTVELDADDARLFVHAHAREGGVVLDSRGYGWLRSESGWSKIEPLPRANVANYSVMGVWMHDPTHIWAIEQDGAVWRYDGAQWQPERSDLREPRALGGSERYLLLGNADGSVARRFLSTP
jgi:hypothetical protein